LGNDRLGFNAWLKKQGIKTTQNNYRSVKKHGACCKICGKELSEFEEKEYGLWGFCKNCFDKETEKVMKERKHSEDEYEKLVHQLVHQFQGKCLEEAIPGKIVTNEHGDCYLIEDEGISEFRKVDYDNLAGFCKNEDLAVIDIETLGFSFESPMKPIILLGVADIRENKVCTRQFLLRDVSEECGAIWAFISHIKNDSTFITYNGRKFDIPYIEQRIAYYGKEASLNNRHYDVLPFTRRALGKRLPNCRLGTVEKYFGIQREKDIDGFRVPQLYNLYMQTRNVGPLVAIVEHNKQDLINLGIVVSRLYELQDLDYPDRSESKGLEIAKAKENQITRINSVTYKVHSQSCDCEYTVYLSNDQWRCECPYYESYGLKCKHIWAVEFSIGG